MKLFQVVTSITFPNVLAEKGYSTEVNYIRMLWVIKMCRGIALWTWIKAKDCNISRTIKVVLKLQLAFPSLAELRTMPSLTEVLIVISILFMYGHHTLASYSNDRY